MNIAVVDDSYEHLAEAEKQLVAHELETFASYTDFLKRLGAGYQPEVLLSDLRMPGEAQTLGDEGMRHFGTPFDAGMFLTFIAARYGIARIAVVTDLNHHDHPASAIIDHIDGASWRGKARRFRLDDSLVVIAHAPLTEGRKDWARVLEALLRDPETE